MMSNRRSACARVRTPLVASLVTALAISITGCATRAEQLAAMARPDRAAVVLFVDGLQPARLDELLANDRLPNIDAVFARAGVRVLHARAALPSVTYANTVTLMTGCLPSTHGITGNRWFDAETGTLRDYGTAATFRRVNADFSPPTLHELVSSGWTASSLLHTSRGADEQHNDPLTNGLDWLFGNYRGVDARSGANIEDITRNALRRGEWPTLQVYYFPGVDETAHRQGIESEAYADAVRNVDRAIGGIVAGVEAVGMRERTYFALVSDHGHAPTPSVVDLRAVLQDERGLRVATHNRGRVGAAEVVWIPNGGRTAAIHLRDADGGWAGVADAGLRERVLRGTGADASALWQHDAIELVAWLENGQLHLATKAGVEMLRTIDEARTTRYNTSTREFVRLLRHPRGGDIVLFAADGYGFEDYASGHGSVLEADMRTVMWYAGPDIARGVISDKATTADLVPTLLELLGVDSAAEFDGVSRARELAGAAR